MPLTKKMLFSLLHIKGGIEFGHDRMYAMHYHTSLTISIRIGTMLYRQIVGIQMCTNNVPLVAYLLFSLLQKGLIIFLSDYNQADVMEAFNKNKTQFV